MPLVQAGKHTSSTQNSKIDGRSIIRQAFIDSGINDSAAEIMLASLSTNTLKQYQPYIVTWAKHSQESDIPLTNPSISDVILFLTKKFHEGLSYGSLNSLRSALSLIIGSHLGNNERIKRLFKGFFKLRPSAPKYNNTWDVSNLLNHIAEKYIDNSNLEMISKKTATLLILATGQRSISCININNIDIKEDCITIKIDKLIKTSAPNKCQPFLTLPFFKGKTEICPARALSDYLRATSTIRNTSMLFISYRKPYKGVSTNTISRWIKKCMEESGIDVLTFTTHSTRHATTSVAFKKGVNIDEIRRTAGWTGESTRWKFQSLSILDLTSRHLGPLPYFVNTPPPTSAPPDLVM
ncbi:hypothetical protein K1T71_000361 [Dendrolimus kikuchii]|uniref:Uncharacterized protein n=1 Tax=Dendrolimus kikuchii TaxID=765133 RepID=A0ACC1DJ07_9NEOP|nr:hypothetical protein K1T71_000361 [Dendrolimus kikuchii]